MKIVKDEIAYEIDHESYKLKATYLIEPKGNALIEIFKGTKLMKDFLFPSYKIWNIPAHADDIINGLERDSDDGLRVAGSDGLGGNSYNG